MAALLGSCSGLSAAFGTRRPTLGARRLCPAKAPVVTCAYGDLPNIGGGRKWEHTPVTANGKPEKVKMHVKKGDTIQVIAGHDKGKIGTITKVLTTTGEVVVEGVNIKTKHIAPKAENEAGQIKKYEFPVHHSNVMHYSKEKQVRSRIGYKINEDGTKVRFLKKTGETI